MTILTNLLSFVVVFTFTFAAVGIVLFIIKG